MFVNIFIRNTHNDVYAHVSVHVHTHVYVHLHTHDYTHVYAHAHANVPAHVHTHVYAYVYLHVHTHIKTCKEINRTHCMTTFACSVRLYYIVPAACVPIIVVSIWAFSRQAEIFD